MNFIKSIFTSIARAQQARVHYWQLQNLTDKELRDIGITRGQIRGILAEEMKR
jgi:uncharacterized protein YjiS (DUF1127 family)